MTPQPPASRRRLRAPDERDFTSPLRSPAVTARVGLWLGVCFLVAFLTGLYSHEAQSAQPWFAMPTGPAWLYRVTQGGHVAAGTAAVPLLLVKLWTVYPKLFARPPRRHPGRLALTVLERGSIAVLVASGIFQLATGLANSAQWYPWGFAFPATHYAVAWVATGSILLHVAVKTPVVRAALARPVEDRSQDPPGLKPTGAGLSRRGLLHATWLTAGVALIATAGGTVPALRRVSVFATRSGRGPGGIPINKSARAAGVVEAASSPDFALTISRGETRRVLTRADLEAMPQTTATLPIACVEGWSATGDWTGVRVRDLTALVGTRGPAAVTARSLQESGPWTVTELPPRFVDDPTTLLALRLAGEPLDLDHGYPCRIIAPNRPGVLQTKWVSELEVTT